MRGSGKNPASALSPTRLLFFFSLASVFDRHHRLRAWNRLTAPARCILLTISLSNLSVKELTFTNVSEVFFY